jgi:cytochrome c oxidase subunit IV
METQKTSKISRTLNSHNRQSSITYRTELDIVKIAFFAVAIAALTRFLSYGINSDLTDAFAWANIKKWTLILTLMFVSSGALIYLFVSLLKRKNAKAGIGPEVND